jgi:hypothetical protein
MATTQKTRDTFQESMRMRRWLLIHGTTCYAFVSAKTNAFLHLASNNLNSLDGNFSMRLIEGELWKLSLMSKMMCHVDKMSCQNVVAFLHQMRC